MEQLLEMDQILRLTGIDAARFRAYRRYGLISGYVEKRPVIEAAWPGRASSDRRRRRAAGFRYLYPRRVVGEIRTVEGLRDKGLTLRQVHAEIVRRRIEEETDLSRTARRYERHITVPEPAGVGSSALRRILRETLAELVRRIGAETRGRRYETLVFLVEPGNPTGEPGVRQLCVRFDPDFSELTATH